jgi:hypothetical protein
VVYAIERPVRLPVLSAELTPVIEHRKLNPGSDALTSAASFPTVISAVLPSRFLRSVVFLTARRAAYFRLRPG